MANIYTQDSSNCYKKDYIENRGLSYNAFSYWFFFYISELDRISCVCKRFAYSYPIFKSKPCHVFTSALGGSIPVWSVFLKSTNLVESAKFWHFSHQRPKKYKKFGNRPRQNLEIMDRKVIKDQLKRTQTMVLTSFCLFTLPHPQSEMQQYLKPSPSPPIQALHLYYKKENDQVF